MSPILLPEILLVFLHTLTAKAKHAVKDWENLPLPIPMHLSETRKTFSEFFVIFLQPTSNFNHFEIKDNRHT